MADCGATGSAIDRSTAQFITSALTAGGSATNNGAEATARAGKAIGSFLGNVAVPTTTATSSAPNPMIPLPQSTMIPTHQTHSLGLIHQQNQHPQQPLPNMSNTSQHQHNHHPMATHLHNNNNTSFMMQQQIHVQQQHQNHRQMRMHHVNQQMNMQMNMMNQQMAMMQMTHQMQQQQQQQHQQQIQNQKLQQEQNQNQMEKLNQSQEEHNNTTVVDPQEQQNQQSQNDINQWHDNLETEFESYLQSYEQKTNTTNINNDNIDDVTSTTNDIGDTTIGHEGHVDGATIEQLASAWREAEEEYNQGSDAMYEHDPTNYYESEYDLPNNEYKPNMKYEFNALSESYGQRQQQQQHLQQQQSQSSEKEYIDLMAEGMKHFHNGNTQEAILCFESQLRNIDPDNSEAWLMLGKCNAENDEDRKAITCLENAVQRDPYSTEALLNLGVSYVNELNYEFALKHLTHWVTHNPNLDVLIDDDNDGNKEDEVNGLDKVKHLLNQAMEFTETNNNGNPESTIDILEALGVVYNVSREYDQAIQCFRTASSRRPNDYQLWNKLGATLANNKQSEEAQDAYQKALSIKPKYARAWLNMAIAHSNLQNHDEAARCYLQTISLNPGAVHVWSYLRIALTCSEKWDLLPLTASQNLDAFKEHYDFVQY